MKDGVDKNKRGKTQKDRVSTKSPARKFRYMKGKELVHDPFELGI